MTLTYTRAQGAGGYAVRPHPQRHGRGQLPAKLDYRTYETMTGATVYQGTILRSRAWGRTNGVKHKPVCWADFNLSVQSVTTKDLNGDTKSKNHSHASSPFHPWRYPASPWTLRSTPRFPRPILTFDYEALRVWRLKTRRRTSPIKLTDNVRRGDGAGLSRIGYHQAPPQAQNGRPRRSTRRTGGEALRSCRQDELSESAFCPRRSIKGGLLFLPYINLAAGFTGRRRNKY